MIREIVNEAITNRMSWQAYQDEILLNKVKAVCDSVEDEDQLPTLKKYCILAKCRSHVKHITDRYIDQFYEEARDRVLSREFYIQAGILERKRRVPQCLVV